jgi:hypothetical protein
MQFFSLSRRVRAATVTVLTVGVGVLSATPAHAAALSTGACDSSALSQPFAHWGDTNEYKIAPGGAFDGQQTSWSLTGRAGLISGGDPYNAGGAPSPSSLSLPAGSSAQSPFTCVNLSYPTFRFFARNADALSTVLVQAVVKVPLVGDVALPVGTFALSGSWQPSQAMLTGSGLTALLSGSGGEVALRFTALTGTSELDDVFVDPRMH